MYFVKFLYFPRYATTFNIESEGLALRRYSQRTHMTNSIEEAIAAESAHDLADALAACGVSTTRNGNGTKCIIPGYGTIWFHSLEQNPGWVVRDECDRPVSDRELAAELAEVVAMKKKIS